jgi:hypothetical protein
MQLAGDWKRKWDAKALNYFLMARDFMAAGYKD